MILASGIFLIDILKFTKPVHFGIIYGENAITVYVIAGLLALALYEPYLAGQSISSYFMNALTGIGLGSKFTSFCFALCCVGLNFIPAYLLHRKNILIRV